MDMVSKWQGVLSLLTRPEGLPAVLMVAAICALAVMSLRGTRPEPGDEKEG